MVLLHQPVLPRMRLAHIRVPLEMVQRLEELHSNLHRRGAPPSVKFVGKVRPRGDT